MANEPSDSGITWPDGATGATRATSEASVPDAYDVVVVGGGAAGLSAAVFLARYGLDTLVLDRGTSAIRRSYLLENLLGFPGGIDPETFLSLGREHVHYEGGTVVEDMAVGIRQHDDVSTGVPGPAEGESTAVEAADSRFSVETQDGRTIRTAYVVAASAYDGDYLADLGPLEHDSGTHPVAAADDGRTDIAGLYIAGWLSGGPHQAITCAGHGARVAKTLLRDHREARGFWPGAAQYWDWCVEAGTYGDEDWEQHVDEWLNETLPEEGIDPRREVRIRGRVKQERLAFQRSHEAREERRRDTRALLRKHLFDEQPHGQHLSDRGEGSRRE